MRILLLILIVASTVSAGPRRIGHYVKTHKLLLLSDGAIVVGAWFEGYTTLKAHEMCPSCPDETYGYRQSSGRVWRGSLEQISLLPLNHFAWHFAPDKVGRCLVVCSDTLAMSFKDADESYLNLQVKKWPSLRLATLTQK